MDENSNLKDGYHKDVLNAFPSPVLIVNRDLEIQDANRAFLDFSGRDATQLLRKLCGDLMHCVHAKGSSEGCGSTEHCDDCVLRQIAVTLKADTKIVRRLSHMKLDRDGKVEDIWLLVSGSPFNYEGEELVILTLEDVTELSELRRMIPICSHCRKVRDDEDYWRGVENYLEKFTGVQFSHSICPDCAKKHYPDLDIYED